MSTLILTRADVARVLDLPACLVAVEEAFRQHAHGTAFPPRVLGVHVDRGAFHIKAAGVRSPAPYFAAKVNANFSSNHERGLPTIQGVIVLADARDGRPLAIMDSIEITEQRTGAATSLAVKLLVPGAPDTPDERATVTIVGCGRQGRIQLRAIALVRPVRAVFAHDVDAARARQFAHEMSTDVDVGVEVTTDLRRALAVSSIVVTCTTSRSPIVFKQDIRPGTFIAAVGADNPEKQEIDPALLAAATVVADVRDQAIAIGDTHHAIAAGLMQPADVYAELGELAIGRKPARRTPDEVVIFDSTGMALQDVLTAAYVYERALERGIGVSLPLTDAPISTAEARHES